MFMDLYNGRVRCRWCRLGVYTYIYYINNVESPELRERTKIHFVALNEIWIVLYIYGFIKCKSKFLNDVDGVWTLCFYI